MAGIKPTPLIVIVGETASGKTALAIALAQRFNGAIIAADSRTVYKGMDIGTAKPTIEEQAGIPHYGLDVVMPDEPFSAAGFKQLALDAIDKISAHHKLPIIVGGTGLYIDSVLYDYQFRPVASTVERIRLQSLSVDELRQEVLNRGLLLPNNDRNPRHLRRVLETNGTTAVSSLLRQNTLVLGLRLDREVLSTRIKQRVDMMVEAGAVEEAKSLGRRYGWDIEALKAPGYRAFKQYITGEITLEEAKQLFVRADTRLAKRQRTWFKRNKSIHWLSDKQQAFPLVENFLSNQL